MVGRVERVDEVQGVERLLVRVGLAVTVLEQNIGTTAKIDVKWDIGK